MIDPVRQEKRLILEGMVRLQQGRCAYCGVSMILFDGQRLTDAERGRIATTDHIEPQWRGGRNVPENRCACCADCNALKGAIDVATFIRLRWNAALIADAERRARAAAREAATIGHRPSFAKASEGKR